MLSGWDGLVWVTKRTNPVIPAPGKAASALTRALMSEPNPVKPFMDKADYQHGAAVEEIHND
jgi:hypothetical protein